MVMLSPANLPKTFFDAGKWRTILLSLARAARQGVGSRLGARYVDALGSKAHFNDRLLASTTKDRVELYRLGAVEIVDVLSRAIGDAGLRWRDIRSCLDVGCGYGRIVRELRFKVSARAISVCDYVEEAAQFTAAEFGVRRLPPAELIGPERNGTFDLVYTLSLYTELDRAMIEMNLAKLAALARVGGVVVFATQGRPAHLDADRSARWFDAAALSDALDRDGFFHAEHPAYLGSRGLTWILPDEVMRMVARTEPTLALIAHYPDAIDDSRDLFVYRKF